eukprot:1888433-Pyramimonas_sp.AAC.2
MLIFEGEVRKAPGTTSDAYAAAEAILFTEDETFFNALDRFDHTMYLSADDPAAAAALEVTPRPSTPGKDSPRALPPPRGEAAVDPSGRPRTCANLTGALAKGGSQGNLAAKGGSQGNLAAKAEAPVGRVLRVQLLSTWGDPYYIGLTGLQVRSPWGRAHVERR